MNQTEKRLNIINLSISIMDKESIQLQVLRLSVIKTDEKIREILNVLEHKNYIEAQKLIGTYIQTPPKNQVLQRSEQNETHYDTLFNIDPKPTSLASELVNYDALLNLEADDILPTNISLDMFNNAQKKEEELPELEEIAEPIEIPAPIVEETNTLNDNKTLKTETETETITSEYPPIPSIQKKFDSMYQHYIPLKQREKHFTSVEAWLLQIAHEGYSESNIYEILNYIHKSFDKSPQEAIELLLITAATDSHYAQFNLARTLYKGNMLERNIEEAFILINQLALNKVYPEAICDLGQFYENGIGVTEDKKRAKKLYKEAMILGVNRAAIHYERVRKETRLFPLNFLSNK